jgi:hypothetical protein
VASLLEQASEALELDPLPELFVVMTIDNDMRCNGTDADNIPAFSDGLDEVLSVISAGAPEATVFITSQWASVEEYTSTMLPIDVDFLTGDGICDVVDPGTTTINPEKAAGLQAIVDLYETAVQQVCAEYPTCQWDNGAAHAMDLEPEHLGPDYSHLSIAGQHALAELEWAALYGE